MGPTSKRPASLEELGARRWANHHPRRVRELQLSSVTFDDDSAIEDFCYATMLRRDQLQELGRVVRERGYCKDITSKPYTLGNGDTGWLLRSVTKSSLWLDGTMPQSADDSATRYITGVSQGGNTCALDVTMFCAIRLDLGRTQIDQLPLEVLLTLEPISRITREIVGKFWGTESLATRNRLRDLLLTTLSSYDTTMHSVGSLQDVKSVVAACFRGSAQLSYTTVRTETCCDSIAYTGPESKLTRRHFVEISPHIINNGGSVQDALQKIFFGSSGERLRSGKSPCSNAEACNFTLRTSRLVLDRMPAVLMVGLHAPITPEKEKTVKVFMRQTFQIQETSRSSYVNYEPLGCIMLHQDKAHFTGRWLPNRPSEGTEGIAYFDGDESDRVSYVGGWYDHSPFQRTTRATASRSVMGPVVVFYQLVRAGQ